jgi:hypothetical protein
MDHHVEQIDAMASHVAKEMVRPLDQQTSDTNFLDMKATPSRSAYLFSAVEFSPLVPSHGAFGQRASKCRMPHAMIGSTASMPKEYCTKP